MRKRGTHIVFLNIEPARSKNVRCTAEMQADLIGVYGRRKMSILERGTR